MADNVKTQVIDLLVENYSFDVILGEDFTRKIIEDSWTSSDINAHLLPMWDNDQDLVNATAEQDKIDIIVSDIADRMVESPKKAREQILMMTRHWTDEAFSTYAEGLDIDLYGAGAVSTNISKMDPEVKRELIAKIVKGVACRMDGGQAFVYELSKGWASEQIDDLQKALNVSSSAATEGDKLDAIAEELAKRMFYEPTKVWDIVDELISMNNDACLGDYVEKTEACLSDPEPNSGMRP